MHPKDALDIVAYLVGIGTTVVVVRSNVKKQIIADQQALIEVLQGKVENLEKDMEKKDERICYLEEVIDGYSELVREGHLSGQHGQGSGNRSASAKTTKNRNS